MERILTPGEKMLEVAEEGMEALRGQAARISTSYPPLALILAARRNGTNSLPFLIVANPQQDEVVWAGINPDNIHYLTAAGEIIKREEGGWVALEAGSLCACLLSNFLIKEGEIDEVVNGWGL